MFIKQKNIIAGRNPVIEALQKGTGVDKVLLNRQASGEHIIQIKELAKQHSVPVQLVPVEKLNQLTNVQHQGVIAFKAAVTYHDLQQVIDFLNEQGEVPLLMILDGVTDVRNIGAIARSAVCCGAQAIIVPDKGVAALGEDAMKSSAGALDHIHICRVNSLMKAIDTLHLNGIKVFSSEMTADNMLHQLNLAEPCAIVMGSEGKGVFTGIQKISDAVFKIPMAGKFESLNVSVAAGMILYEAMKQRMKV
jgi:23S rRNA (guanosine2251-2'-O)-methyltransferase